MKGIALFSSDAAGASCGGAFRRARRSLVCLAANLASLDEPSLQQSRDVVERAIDLSGELPDPLQHAQVRAIFAMLSKRMLAAFLEETMDLSKLPERPAMRKARLFFEGKARAEGLAEGKRAALLTLLDARGLAVSDAERATIEACSDQAQIDGWIRRAATAATTGEVLAHEPAPRRAARAKPSAATGEAPKRPARRGHKTRS